LKLVVVVVSFYICKLKTLIRYYNHYFIKLEMTEKATLYVGNLVPEVDEDSLRAAFIPFGEIKSVDIPIDHVTGIIPFY
jgi:hypothetical protein